MAHSTTRRPEPAGSGPDAGRSWAAAPSVRAGLAWTATTVLVVTVALVLQSGSLHRRTAELDRREKALAEMQQIVGQLKKNNDEREQRLHDVADNLEQMYRMMRTQVPAKTPLQDPAVRPVEHRLGELPPDLPPTVR